MAKSQKLLTRIFVLTLSTIFGVVRNIQLLLRTSPDCTVDPTATVSHHSTMFHESHEGSIDYVKSLKSFQRALQFLHIPKTGGTTIEISIAAGQANISWGYCRYRKDYTRRRSPCFGCKSSWLTRHETKNNKSTTTRPEKPWIGQPSLWHVLPHLFPLDDNPYDDFDVFTVIREPIDRALSEYHYQCEVLGRKRLCRMNPDRFLGNKMKELLRHRSEVAKYFIDDSHFVPQHEYIMRPLQVRQVDYVLSLSDGSIGYKFNRTVEAFHLPMHWPGNTTRYNHADRSTNKHKTLAPDVEQRLRTYFAEDYKFFFQS